MTTFFTSDLHINHVNIITYSNRPFHSVFGEKANGATFLISSATEQMNEALVTNWNETVGIDDEIWVLGDWSMANQMEGLKFVQRLNGTKRLIAGNHDKCWRNGQLHEAWTETFLEAGFATVSLEERILLDPEDDSSEVLLNHFPYQQDDRHGSRYAECHPQDDGYTWLLHGHVHTEWRYLDPRQINVGVDMWDYKPVSAEQLLRFQAAWIIGFAV